MTLNDVTEEFATTILEFAGESYMSPMLMNLVDVTIDRDVFADDGSGVGFMYFADETVNPDGYACWRARVLHYPSGNVFTRL